MRNSIALGLQTRPYRGVRNRWGALARLRASPQNAKTGVRSIPKGYRLAEARRKRFGNVGRNCQPLAREERLSFDGQGPGRGSRHCHDVLFDDLFTRKNRRPLGYLYWKIVRQIREDHHATAWRSAEIAQLVSENIWPSLKFEQWTARFRTFGKCKTAQSKI